MPRTWPINRPPRCQGTPPGIEGRTCDGRSPGSRMLRLLPPSQVHAPVAKYGKLSAYSCGGSCGVRARCPSPHSLFTPHLRRDRQFSPTKGRGGKPCQRRRHRLADRACGRIAPVYSPAVVGSRACRGMQDGNAANEPRPLPQLKAASCASRDATGGLRPAIGNLSGPLGGG
jgi:hypothetical protein